MANSTSHAALPYPIRKARYTITVPYLDSSGTPTDPTTPDTEISVDGGTFADCTEEVTTISGSNGFGYITLTGAEMDCSLIAVAAKVASGPKNTLLYGVPRVLAIVGSGTLSVGSSGGGTLGTLLAYDVTGCFIRTTGGTGGGGTGGANNQARKIVTYTVSTGAFTVTPNWETTPSTDTTYDVLLPENVTLGMLKTLNPATAGRTLAVDAFGLGDANVAKWIGVAPNALIAGRVDAITNIRSGTAQTGSSSTTIKLDSGASATDSIYNRNTVMITGGTGFGQPDRIITAYVGSTKVATITPAWLTTPDNTTTFTISPAGSVNLETILGVAVDPTTPQLGVDAITIGGLSTAVSVLNTWLLNAFVIDPWDGVVIPRVAKSGVYDSPGDVPTIYSTSGGYAAREQNFFSGGTNTIADIGTLTVNERNSVADALLNRNLATGTDNNTRSLRNAVRVLRNKVSLTAVAGYAVVYKEDGSTEAFRIALTTDAAALPIVAAAPST